MIESATDEVAVMYAGRTVEAGATRDVLGKPFHPYTEALLNALPSRAEPGEPLRTIGGRPPLPGEISEGCAFAPRCPEFRADCEIVRPLAVEVERAHQVVCLLHQEGGS
jgi:oligopeptide/dipeptide ABC transporter ATP-binding protein